MLVAGKEIENYIQKLSQMARAAGIHIIMATQRPSVDVITGTIKANFPTRISFQVSSKFDSRTILGTEGSERLLGKGDMLLMMGGGRTTRIHGPFVSDKEVEKIVGKNGIDVVYDGVGEKTFEGSIECLKVRGMMVSFGNASGYVHKIDVKKHINAKGLFFTRPSIAHYTITREELVESAKKVFDAVISKKIKIEISKKYSLEQAKNAHEDLEARKLIGPAVIIPS